ncbi:MAG: mycothiol transferase [Acidothermaceae bacterium]
MKTKDVIADGYGRVQTAVHGVVDDLKPDHLTYRIDPEANTIAWLIWHLARVQDDHVADVARADQVWITDGWFERFGLPFDRKVIGYGMSRDEVGAVKIDDPQLLLDYVDAVTARTLDHVAGLTDDDLDRVVDTRWDPPVTLGVRLVSVIEDDLQHVGQAAYVKGVAQRMA